VRGTPIENSTRALILDNAQGELSPLEIGLHALHFVGKATAGRGKKGGLSEYAETIGRTQGNMSQLVAAAEVTEDVKKSIRRLMDLLDRSSNLFEIHAAPRDQWSELVQRMPSTVARPRRAPPRYPVPA
jgi:hypothetical protein